MSARAARPVLLLAALAVTGSACIVDVPDPAGKACRLPDFPCRAGETCSAEGFCQASGGMTPTLFQDFEPPWADNKSPDQIWLIAGPWVGGGGNMMDPANAVLSETFNGEVGGFLALTVTANEMRGAEVQTVTSYSYGYYEARILVSNVPGVNTTFFWRKAPDFGDMQWAVAFLTNEPWLDSESSGQVYFLITPPGEGLLQTLPFNPSKDFHRYGFLWVPGKLSFTVDGAIVREFADPGLTTTNTGFIMADTWTGNPEWGGGPPTADATTVYDWIKFYEGVTAVP